MRYQNGKSSSEAAEQQDMSGAEGPRFSAGSVVELAGLTQEELNGSLGVVKKFYNDRGRYEIIVSGRRKSLGIRDENLTQGSSIIRPDDSAFANSRRYQHVAFWPRIGGVDVLPVHAFDDWPEDNHNERTFLRNRLGWANPQIYGGVEGRMSAKPDFMMYFDADDQVSPVNRTALAIKDNLPPYELSKLPRGCQDRPPRGVCVLIYSPLKSVVFSGGVGMNPPVGAFPNDGTEMTSGNANRQFTLEQLRDTLLFQESSEGRAQYSAHDNPMHRMFGGMM